MKKTMMVGMLLCLMAFSFGINLLNDSGFESGESSGTPNVFSTSIPLYKWAITDEVFHLSGIQHSGSWSIGINKLSGTGSNKGFEQIVPFNPGNYTRMRFSIWNYLWDCNSSKNAAYVRFLNSSKGVIKFYSTSFDPKKWVWIQRNITGMTIPAGTAYVQVVVTTTTSMRQIVLYDDATLEPYTP